MASAESAELAMAQRTGTWFVEEGVWWAASFVFHAALMTVLMIVGVRTQPARQLEDFLDVARAETPKEPPVFDPIDSAPPQPDQGDFTLLAGGTSQMTFAPAPSEPKDGVPATGFPGSTGPLPLNATSIGLGGNVKISSLVDRVRQTVPDGSSKHPGSLGNREGRGKGTWSGTRETDRSVVNALRWIARHQSRDGSWSLEGYRARCKDATCSGPGMAKAEAAATALSLLPLLAAGNQHDRQGEFRNAVGGGLQWLVRNQRPGGDLSAGSPQKMYSHGLATIALCEAYGMSGDASLRRPAQLAVDFIEKCQHPRTGGWRYQPGDEGDTSVFGWQLMALKSAEIATLKVRPESFDRARQWLQRAATGPSRGLFSYTPGSPPSPAMTAVGLLCAQYLHMSRSDPAMVEGAAYLANHLPEARGRSLYYWYYATQVMHNLLGPPWDTWNRKMRRILVESQVREGCAAGSWDPLRPMRDPLGEPGGRLCVTSLATLTLEVYYRHLPLYKLDGELAGGPGE